MSYEIIVGFQSLLANQTLIDRMQDVYDNNGVDGMFFITGDAEHKIGTFHRETEDDYRFILDRVQDGAPRAAYEKAAVEQLLAELTVFTPCAEIQPIIDALRRDGVIVKNIGEVFAACGEEAWTTLCNEQGWNDQSQVAHLEGFLRQAGLFSRFAQYVQAAADVENGIVRSPAGAFGQASIEEVPTAVLQINGGVINTVSATAPVRVIILDEDTEGGDEENILVIDGERVYVHDYRLNTIAESGMDGIAPDYVAAVIAQMDGHEGAAQ